MGKDVSMFRPRWVADLSAASFAAARSSGVLNLGANRRRVAATMLRSGRSAVSLVGSPARTGASSAATRCVDLLPTQGAILPALVICGMELGAYTMLSDRAHPARGRLRMAEHEHEPKSIAPRFF